MDVLGQSMTFIANGITITRHKFSEFVIGVVIFLHVRPEHCRPDLARFVLSLSVTGNCAGFDPAMRYPRWS